MSNKMKMAREEIRADAEQQWKSDAALRAEFSHNFDRYLAYEASIASGRTKVLGGQVQDA